jgi:gliding motility-associated-like protein
LKLLKNILKRICQNYCLFLRYENHIGAIMLVKHLKIVLVFVFLLKTLSSNAQVEVTATGDQYYCPLTQQPIVTSVSIINPSGADIAEFYIQISEGYVSGEDRLYLPFTPQIGSSWSVAEGKLTLFINSGTSIAQIIAAIESVYFESSSATPSGVKTFSLTAGEANYLPQTGHFYEFVNDVGITWQNAKTAAEARSYYGLQGYLATITSAEEAQLTGEQATGTGWIGASDATVEGDWRWVTGPENGQLFWRGLANGSAVNGMFSYWNTGEPNQTGDEDYAHITAPSIGIKGSWNDLSNTGATSGDYQPKGYIVEYGGMPGDPVLKISGSSTLTIPEITSAPTVSRCGQGSITLSAVASAGNVVWFSSATGGSPIATGSTITQNITTSTTFYALASVGGCLTGKRTAVEAVINEIPTITSVSTNTVICTSGSTTLSAQATSGLINWYTNATGGSPIATGNTFTTPNLTTTTTYYVDATDAGCTTLSRTAVTATIANTPPPTANAVQNFCDGNNPTLVNLNFSGTNVKWYASPTGGTPLNVSEPLVNNTTIYGSQTIDGCESSVRQPVTIRIFESPNPLNADAIQKITVCDDESDGSGTNGIALFDLTVRELDILNGQSASDFSLSYYTDAAFLQPINTPSNYKNDTRLQTIYVKMTNVNENSCFESTSFEIEVFDNPQVNAFVVLQNCDEDGSPDGYTNFNLNEAVSLITTNATDLNFLYYLSLADAQNSVNTLNAASFNNSVSQTVFARIETQNGCVKFSEIQLNVSTTSLPSNFNFTLENCDEDSNNDGFYAFDLNLATNNFLNKLPPGQNLTVSYYRNLIDAQLEQNKIDNNLPFINEEPVNQTLYVRVENSDNNACYGIGPHLTINVLPKPEFEVQPSATICLNQSPITIGVFNAQDVYIYEWYNESGVLVGTDAFLIVSEAGVYKVIATGNNACISEERTVSVTASELAQISINNITVTDNSDNNSITINNLASLGLGEYEFALNDENGPYQDDPFFDDLAPGIHTLFIRDKNGCGTAQIEISILGFPKFFTPNNDGFNDTFQIKGLSSQFQNVSTIYIFDRFGKVVAEIDPNKEGWNGVFNGELLPATDYWYSFTVVDQNGISRTIKGHFSLIRR